MRIDGEVGLLQGAHLVGFPLVVDDAQFVDGDDRLAHGFRIGFVFRIAYFRYFLQPVRFGFVRLTRTLGIPYPAFITDRFER